MRDSKINVVLRFQLNEIKYDVEFDSWLRNKVFNQLLHNSNPDAESVSYKLEDRATDWLARKIDNCIGEIHGELNWAICQGDEAKLRSNGLTGLPTEWIVHLEFNSDWVGSPRAMQTQAHKFVVAELLYEWNRACDKMDSASVYKQEANDALESLYQEARNERVEYMPFRL